MSFSFLLLSVFFMLPFTKCQSTNFIDKDSKLQDFAEPNWYKENIPFIELPDEVIEEVYYYRWSSHKRHLRYTTPGAGYTITEFIQTLERDYNQKFDAICAAAGHHIYESRWLRNQRYIQDYINFWARESSQNQQYSEWIADASYAAFLVNADLPFIKSQQKGFVTNFNGWSNNFHSAMNMFTITPHNDAMEHSASSEQSEDGMFGGWGYRPSFNSEMFANAIAISKIAALNNDTAISTEFLSRAKDIQKAVLEQLWDDERAFFFHMFSDNNPTNQLLDTREEIGFFPWRFGIIDPNDPKYSAAWEHLFDPKGFNSSYGPTTCEQRSQWFDGNQTNICCWWNGNSWPYSTGLTLNSLASQIKNYGETATANVQNYINLLHQYAVTQHLDGKPYVGECHSPLYEFWVCDARNHSEHYAHSTYVDNILADLIGIEPQADDTFQVNPKLIPSSWKYFLAENVPYHGHNITVLYDSDGLRYQTGNVGLHIYVNGALIAVQPSLELLKVPIPIPNLLSSSQNSLENYATNVYSTGYPRPDASFTSVWASTWQAIDGRIFYDSVPSNRWTNWDSPNELDWFSIDFGPGRAKTINQVKLYIFSDFATGQGSVDCPTSIKVEYFNSTTSEWEQVLNQDSNICVPNDVLTITFDPVRTQRTRLIFSRDVNKGTYVGFTELEIWAEYPQTGVGIYEAEDGLLRASDILASEGASAGSFVGHIDTPESSVEITGVWADEDEEQLVQMYFANGGDSIATLSLNLNNIHFQNISFPVTSGGWGRFDDNDFVSTQVPLLRGKNVFIFNRGENRVELDKFVITQANKFTE